MNLCTAALAASFSKPMTTVLLAYAGGLLGILGWGLLLEVAFRNHYRQFSVCHGFLQGSILVSILLLGFSLAGVARPAFLGVAAAGCVCLIGASLFLWKSRTPSARLVSGDDLIDATLAGALVAPMFLMLARALPLYSDAAAIWFFHAKELVCEPLFQSHYIRERLWAGTHSEYPLFVPLIHAYFFALSDSFRDDWLALWQIVLAMAALVLWFDAIRRRPGGWLLAGASSVMILAVLYPEIVASRVEFCSVVFALLTTLSLVTGEWSRMPLYLFGLAFTKNEGLVVALVCAVLLATIAPAAERRARLRSLVPFACLLIAWLPVQLMLPSNHEQYPSRLLTVSAWAEGLSHIGAILQQCFLVARERPWNVALILLPAGLAASIARRRRDPGMRLVHLLLWPAAMLAIFLAIYVVSIWGPQLPRVTFARLLAEIAMPMQIGLLLLAAALVREPVRWVSAIGLVLCAALTINSGIALTYEGYHLLQYTLRRARAGDFGLGAYRNDPDWRRAFELDAQLPPAARGGGVNVDDHLVLNYTLYPRYIYTARPEVIARTTLPWAPWVRVEDIPYDELGFQFVVEGNRVVARPKPSQR